MNLVKIKIIRKNSKGLILTIKKDKIGIKKEINKADELIEELDKVLEKSKIKIESLKKVSIEIDKEIGLTSCRVAKAIEKALNFQN